MARDYIRWFEEIGIGDVASVGGKNASLGEMLRNLGRDGIKVPPGFATTADGYRHFIEANNLETLIASTLAELKGEKVSVAELGLTIRAALLKARCPEDLAGAICQAYRDLSQRWWMKPMWRCACATAEGPRSEFCRSAGEFQCPQRGCRA